MDHANHYYEKILRPYLTSSHPDLFISKDITSSDATTLKATELHNDSSTGIVIIPGITVPRESCYQFFLVEIYEGSITFESQVGKGTTFVVALKH